MGRQSPDGEDRRQFLKRAGAVAGATVWAVPTMQVVRMASASAQTTGSVVVTPPPPSTTVSLQLVPVIEFDHAVIGEDFVNYYYRIVNIADFPSELFVAAPHLPPCGLNANASRTWIHFFNSYTGARLYGHCGITWPIESLVLRFPVMTDETPPSAVELEMWDRETGRRYRSASVAVPTVP